MSRINVRQGKQDGSWMSMITIRQENKLVQELLLDKQDGIRMSRITIRRKTRSLKDYC